MPSSLLAGRPQAYEKQRGARREEQKELQRAAAQDQVRGFLEKEAAIVSRPLNPFTPKAASGDSPGEGEVDLKAGAILVGPRASLGAKSEPLPASQMTPNPGPARARRQGQGQSAAQLLDPVADPRGQGHKAGEAGGAPHPSKHPCTHFAREGQGPPVPRGPPPVPHRDPDLPLPDSKPCLLTLPGLVPSHAS